MRIPPVGKAQRPFHEAKANEIAARFDINCFGYPAVCRVDAVNWLVDGQHRLYALQHSDHASSTDEIECEVYIGLDLSEMARMFLGRNHSSPVTAYERFGVAVTAGYSPEVEIDKLVSSVGLKVGHPAKGNVFSVAALLLESTFWDRCWIVGRRLERLAGRKLKCIGQTEYGYPAAPSQMLVADQKLRPFTLQHFTLPPGLRGTDRDPTRPPPSA